MKKSVNGSLRQIVAMMVTAALIAVALVAFASRTRAMSYCEFSGGEPGGPAHSFDIGGWMDGVTFEEKPAYNYIDWGDGSTYYLERNQGQTIAFAVEHVYPSAGEYNLYWEIGTMGAGVCATHQSIGLTIE